MMIKKHMAMFHGEALCFGLFLTAESLAVIKGNLFVIMECLVRKIPFPQDNMLIFLTWKTI